jgi:hypothetical protein
MFDQFIRQQIKTQGTTINLVRGLKTFLGRSQKFGLRVEARDETIGEDKRIFFPRTRINFARAPDSSIDSDARAMRSLLCQCG